jgi:hypothetical protein
MGSKVDKVVINWDARTIEGNLTRAYDKVLDGIFSGNHVSGAFHTACLALKAARLYDVSCALIFARSPLMRRESLVPISAAVAHQTPKTSSRPKVRVAGILSVGDTVVHVDSGKVARVTGFGPDATRWVKFKTVDGKTGTWSTAKIQVC